MRSSGSLIETSFLRDIAIYRVLTRGIKPSPLLKKTFLPTVGIRIALKR